MLGITRSDVVFLNDKARYKMVVIGSSLTHDGLPNTPPHKKVFDIINRLDGDYDAPEKIYISRRTWINNKGIDYTKHVERRRCVNEDDVVSLFKERGFVEVFCENLSMKEKIGLFRGAKVIAGPIGGGFTNVIFSPSSTKVISIDSPTFFDINYRVKYVMSHTQLHHFTDTEFVGRVDETIESIGSLSISGGLNSPWKVDIDKLIEFLDNV